jgi:hypothetical protein
MSQLAPDDAFSAVFVGEDLVAGPFQRRLSDRAVIFPLPDYRVPRDLSSAIASATNGRCYLVFIGVLAGARTGRYAASVVDLEDYDGYHARSAPPIPQALAAVDGSWGAMIADDGFGLIGGSRGFLASIRGVGDQVDFNRYEVEFEREFAGDRERLGVDNWVDRVLNHVHEFGDPEFEA